MIITPSALTYFLAVFPSVPSHSFSLPSVVSFHISLQILYILLLFFFHALFSACLYVLSFFKPVLLHYILYVSIIAPFLRLVISLRYVLNFISRYILVIFSSLLLLMLILSLYLNFYYVWLLPAVYIYFSILVVICCSLAYKLQLYFYPASASMLRILHTPMYSVFSH